MAVVADAPPVPRRPVRTVRSLDFVRLKLRLAANSYRGRSWRVVAFVIGLVVGLGFAVLAALGLTASAAASRDVGYVVAAFAGTAVVLGWTLIPLLFFGVDETLDPARFALLPVRRMVLARGMLAAAFVGVPALATLVATAGLALAAGLRFGLPIGLVALAGVVAGLVLGVVASRAVTSAFAALLRSRRVRDLAAVIIALLASSIGPLQWVIAAAAQNGSVEQAVRVADVLSWTPFAAPYVLPYDVAAGHWIAMVLRAAITAVSIGLLLWWWSLTLESAMLGTTSGRGARRSTVDRGGAVRALVPAPLRAVRRPGAFVAIAAREARFWWRDGRRRAAFVSILMASAVLPVALNFSARNGVQVSGGLSAVGFSFAITMAGTMGGMLLGNQFGYDGNAYAGHLLARVRGSTELRARGFAIALVALPVQAGVVVAVALLSGQLGQLPSGLGMLTASFGSAVAAAAVLSVLAPYALPENSNPFAVNSGLGTAKGLLAMLALIGTLAICMPMVVLSYVLGSSAALAWVVLAVGVAYGLGAGWLGTLIAGDILDRRGPEILAAVTPKR